MILALYLIYENNKGEDSFWKPYIDLMPDVKFFCDWEEHFIMATQDFTLLSYAKAYSMGM